MASIDYRKPPPHEPRATASTTRSSGGLGPPRRALDVVTAGTGDAAIARIAAHSGLRSCMKPSSLRPGGGCSWPALRPCRGSPARDPRSLQTQARRRRARSRSAGRAALSRRQRIDQCAAPRLAARGLVRHLSVSRSDLERPAAFRNLCPTSRGALTQGQNDSGQGCRGRIEWRSLPMKSALVGSAALPVAAVVNALQFRSRSPPDSVRPRSRCG